MGAGSLEVREQGENEILLPRGLSLCCRADPVAGLGSTFEPVLCTELSATAVRVNVVNLCTARFLPLLFFSLIEFIENLLKMGNPFLPELYYTNSFLILG